MKPIRLALFLLALLPALAGAQEPAPPAGQPADPAPSYACDDADLEARLAGLKEQAEAGDAEAARKIYTQYALKGHTPQGEAWSGRYLQILEDKAEAGDTEVMYTLGIIYLTGKDYAAQDTGKGVKWLHRAMEAGHADAAFTLGGVFERQKDKEGSADAFAKAYKAYSAKAGEGDAAALYRKAWLQMEGKGTAANPVEGIAALEQSAEKGYAPAMEQLFRVYVWGAGVPKDMGRALQYAKMCADTSGNGKMAFAVASMCLQGQGVPVDVATGEKYLDKAASANIPSAILLKAVRLKEAGKEEEAFPYFMQGASMRIIPCMTEVGLDLLHGRAGQPQDEARGIALLERASDLWETCQTEAEFTASALAAYELARYYEEKGEPELADNWYIEASTHGYTPAFAKRGWMHLNPFSKMTWDPTKAYRWWVLGKERGDATCSLYVNVFRYVFIPLMVILAFGIPIFVVSRLNKKRRAENTPADE